MGMVCIFITDLDTHTIQSELLETINLYIHTHTHRLQICIYVDSSFLFGQQFEMMVFNASCDVGNALTIAD